MSSAGPHGSAPSARLPSLDGLRALSIALVLVGHSSKVLHLPTLLQTGCGLLARMGVCVFFAISGFIITHLLLEERERTGRVSLRAFYLRRALRIVPPFFAYLALLALARRVEGEPLPLDELAAAGGFAWDYLAPRQSWALGHSWSLAVEEQFYLLWPGLLLLAGRRRGLPLALALIAGAPLLRGAIDVLAPGSREPTMVTLHGRIDTLMFGCALALLWRDARFQAALRRLPSLVVPGALAFLFVVSPVLTILAQGRASFMFLPTAEGVGLALLLAASVAGVSPRWSRLLNARPVVHLGLISYSLYLYQQPFLDPTRAWAERAFPLTLVAAWVCAELSYRAIEQPAGRLRSRFGLQAASADPSRLNPVAASQEVPHP